MGTAPEAAGVKMIVMVSPGLAPGIEVVGTHTRTAAFKVPQATPLAEVTTTST